MSILLDWAMPKACRDCSLQIGGYCQMYSDDMRRLDDVNLIVERPDWCPLIQVPTPHGRLIDKTKLKRELFVNFMGERIPFYDCDNFPTTLTYIDLHSILSEQPTVIEAEE